MEIELQLQGQDATPEILEEVEDWLRDAQIPGLVVKHESRPGKPGEMSFDVAIAKAFADAVKSFFQYLETRRPSLTFTVETAKGKVTGDVKNIKDPDAVVGKILSLL
jgi:hypothetical protein